MEKITILWADDEIDLLKPHVMFLNEKGYKVITSNSGGEAIELLKTNIVDIDSTYSVDNLRVINYLNKETNRQEIGVLAHELQNEYPYLVNGEKDGEELQSVNYIGIIGILIKEIQLLKKKIYNV